MCMLHSLDSYLFTPHSFITKCTSGYFARVILSVDIRSVMCLIHSFITMTTPGTGTFCTLREWLHVQSSCR